MSKTLKLSQLTAKLKTLKALRVGDQFRLTWIGGFSLPCANFVIGVARPGGSEAGLLMVNHAPICTDSELAATVACEAARSNPNWSDFTFNVRRVAA